MKKTFDPRGRPYELYQEDTNGGSAFWFFFLIGVIVLVCYSSVLLLNEFDTMSISSVQGDRLRAKISWYWPPLLGPNCAVVKNGQCVSRMASGQPWQKWVGRAVACPSEFPFGTEFLINGKRWVCLDRGGAIKRVNNNTIWLDMLTSKPQYKFGTVVDVTVIKK
jgi:hypothetical protein